MPALLEHLELERTRHLHLRRLEDSRSTLHGDAVVVVSLVAGDLRLMHTQTLCELTLRDTACLSALTGINPLRGGFS